MLCLVKISFSLACDSAIELLLCHLCVVKFDTRLCFVVLFNVYLYCLFSQELNFYHILVVFHFWPEFKICRG